MWKERNNQTFNGIDPNPFEVINRATSANFEFWNASVLTPTQSSNVDPRKNNIRCKPLPEGFLRINWDGSYNVTLGKAGIGIIFRNEHSLFQWGFIDKVKFMSAFMTQTLAFKRALFLGIDLTMIRYCLKLIDSSCYKV